MPPTSRHGTIHRIGEHATITFERRLPYPIAAVWAAITDPSQRQLWFGKTALEPRVGGMIEMTADGPPAPPEMRKMTGRIRVWDPPHVFEHEWKQTVVGDTVVRYELTEDGEATILRFTHLGLKASHAEGYIPGQHAYLDRLEAHLGGAGLPVWTERYAEVKSAYV
ncbi:SRPBCC family protein [Hyalangium versicolor]|uniref:SRPBCC family protein n=1 Tax=Hyalangium versicolor TaxID=2861190 RepID=UPI001CCD7628|nr:SRPBCC family protein [Hyalangium versicolor]